MDPVLCEGENGVLQVFPKQNNTTTLAVFRPSTYDNERPGKGIDHATRVQTTDVHQIPDSGPEVKELQRL
jgi:hypothetical protein